MPMTKTNCLKNMYNLFLGKHDYFFDINEDHDLKKKS